MIATAAIPLNLATAVAATAPLREHTMFLRSVGDAGTARFAKQLAEVVARPRRDFARMTASVAGVPPVARGLNAHVAPQRDVLRMVNEALNSPFYTSPLKLTPLSIDVLGPSSATLASGGRGPVRPGARYVELGPVDESLDLDARPGEPSEPSDAPNAAQILRAVTDFVIWFRALPFRDQTALYGAFVATLSLLVGVLELLVALHAD